MAHTVRCLGSLAAACAVRGSRTGGGAPRPAGTAARMTRTAPNRSGCLAPGRDPRPGRGQPHPDDDRRRSSGQESPHHDGAHTVREPRPDENRPDRSGPSCRTRTAHRTRTASPDENPSHSDKGRTPAPGTRTAPTAQGRLTGQEPPHLDEIGRTRTDLPHPDETCPDRVRPAPPRRDLPQGLGTQTASRKPRHAGRARKPRHAGRARKPRDADRARTPPRPNP